MNTTGIMSHQVVPGPKNCRRLKMGSKLQLELVFSFFLVLVFFCFGFFGLLSKSVWECFSGIFELHVCLLLFDPILLFSSMAVLDASVEVSIELSDFFSAQI